MTVAAKIIWFLSRTKKGKKIIGLVLAICVGLLLIPFIFLAAAGSVFVSAAFGDTFYFPIVYHTTPSEPYDPNRVIVHEYEETVMVPVLDKNGKPKKDEDGNVIMNEEIHKFEEEIQSPHFGVDFNVSEGTYVSASRSGTVVSVYENEEDGKTVVIEHLDHWRSIYKHLSSVRVQNGEEVLMGYPIGQAGMTGSCTPYDRDKTFHLHFEITRDDGNLIDPMSVLEDWGDYLDFAIEQIKEVAQGEWNDWGASDAPAYIEWDGENFLWPVQGYTSLSSDYGYRNFGGGEFHRGIDIPAPAGTPIYAAAAGVVSTKAHWSYGIAVKVSVDGRMTNIYGHMIARAEGITDGASVVAGQLIGYVGSTGNSTGNHLHFEVNVDRQPVDPKQFFSLVSLELCKQKKPRKYRGFKGFVSKKPRRNAGLIALKILPCELLAFCKQKNQAALRLDVTGAYIL